MNKIAVLGTSYMQLIMINLFCRYGNNTSWNVPPAVWFHCSTTLIELMKKQQIAGLLNQSTFAILGKIARVVNNIIYSIKVILRVSINPP